MENASRGSGIAPAAMMTLVVAALGGWLWIGGLKSFRPDTPIAHPRQRVDSEVVDARLWQDPIMVVRRHVAARGGLRSDEPVHPAHDVLRLGRDLARRGRDGDVLVMPVLVPAGSYVENQEMRRRHRYAIVSALGRDGYAPVSAEHVGYVETRWVPGDDDGLRLSDADPIVTVNVPFEWFQADDREAADLEAVLVLWLEEDVFTDLRLLDDLLRHVLDAPGLGAAGLEEGRVAVRMIGPATSTGLIAILNSATPEPPRTLDRASTEERETGADPADPAVAALTGSLVQTIDLYLGALTPARRDKLVARVEKRLASAGEDGQVILDERDALIDLVEAAIDGIDPEDAGQVVDAWLPSVLRARAPADPLTWTYLATDLLSWILDGFDDRLDRAALHADVKALYDEAKAEEGDVGTTLLAWPDGKFDLLPPEVDPEIRAGLQGFVRRAMLQAVTPKTAEVWASLLVEAFDDYLDTGLPEGMGRRLRATLPDLLRPALESKSGAAIVAVIDPVLDAVRNDPDYGRVQDSDPDWAARVMREKRQLVLDSRTPLAPETAASELIVLADGYLADGLPYVAADGRTEAQVVRELAAALTTIRDDDVDRKNVIETMIALLTKAYPDVRDSNKEWGRAVVETWIPAMLAIPDPSAPAPSRAAPGNGSTPTGAPVDPKDTKTRVVTMAPGFALSYLDIYSSRATAPADDIIENLRRDRAIRLRTGVDRGRPQERKRQDRPAEERQDSVIAEWVTSQVTGGRRSTRFVQTILPDNVLARALVDELDRSHIEFDGQHQIALVGEWDTFYGRSFRDTMKEAIVNRRLDQLESEWLDEMARHDHKGHADEMAELAQRRRNEAWAVSRLVDGFVRSFSYLRGLDGAVPTAGAADADPKPEEATTSQKTAMSDLERPSGRSQLDYMRRLADRIMQMEEIDGIADNLRAIGITGSDVYDKQLVLQALRKRFPNAVFFTTDLDSRLFHPDQYRWSRNLLIASTYGLALTEELQGDIPPFRDGYQTATFLAVLFALGDGQYGRFVLNGRLGHAITDLHSPRLFEISRGGAFELTPHESEDTLGAVSYDSKIHERRAAITVAGPGKRRWNRYGRTVLLTVIELCLIGMLFRVFAVRGRPWPVWKYALAAFGTGCGVLLVVLILHDQRSGRGEPFALVEGLSIWPTELLRLLTFFLSVGFLIDATQILKESNRKLGSTYGLPAGRPSLDAPLQRWVKHGEQEATKAVTKGLVGVANQFKIALFSLRWLLAVFSVRFWPRGEPDDAKSAVTIWEEYLYRGLPVNRTVRCFYVTAVFAALVLILREIFVEPVIPARGDFAYAVAYIIAVLTMLAVAVLTIFIADVTRLCQQFATILADQETEWPDEAYERVREYKLHPKDASEFLDVLVIAERTEVVGRLVLMPFLTIFLMLVARASIFDKWEWPVFWFAFFALLTAYPLLCAYVLRRAAEASRAKAIGRLQTWRAAALSGAEPTAEERQHPFGDARASQIDWLIGQISGLKRGAYAPWSRHPIFQAMLIPFGGVGVLALLEVMALFGI